MNLLSAQNSWFRKPSKATVGTLSIVYWFCILNNYSWLDMLVRLNWSVCKLSSSPLDQTDLFVSSSPESQDWTDLFVSLSSKQWNWTYLFVSSFTNTPASILNWLSASCLTLCVKAFLGLWICSVLRIHDLEDQ
jgi:hypothetical protein